MLTTGGLSADRLEVLRPCRARLAPVRWLAMGRRGGGAVWMRIIPIVRWLAMASRWINQCFILRERVLHQLRGNPSCAEIRANNLKSSDARLLLLLSIDLLTWLLEKRSSIRVGVGHCKADPVLTWARIRMAETLLNTFLYRVWHQLSLGWN